jgi:hypothetical protein
LDYFARDEQRGLRVWTYKVMLKEYLLPHFIACRMLSFDRITLTSR